MKKLFIVAAAFAFTFGASAQEPKTQSQTTENSKTQKQSDHLVMKNGKMMMVTKDGKTSKMQKDMVLHGVEVTTNGVVTMQNGKTVHMHNGDQIDMNGKMTKMPKK